MSARTSGADGPGADELGALLPDVRTGGAGPASRALGERLRRV